jgi:hypothetical protein
MKNTLDIDVTSSMLDALTYLCVLVLDSVSLTVTLIVDVSTPLLSMINL